MEIEVIDISNKLGEPEDMSLCCLCDQPILVGEPAVVGEGNGCLCLVHQYCAEG